MVVPAETGILSSVKEEEAITLKTASKFENNAPSEQNLILGEIFLSKHNWQAKMAESLCF